MSVKKLEINYRNEKLNIEYFLKDGKEATLLYLHGAGCSKNDFLEATKIPHLDKYKIVAFDFPGCGNSSYPNNQSFNIDDLVNITNLVIKELNLDNIILLGHSMGGLVGIFYIKKYNNIKEFINIEGNLASENCVFSRKIAYKADFTEFISKKFPELQKSLAESKNTGFQKWARALKKSSPQAFYDYCPSIVQHSDNGKILEYYINLDIPTLYVHGSENTENLKFLNNMKKYNYETAEISNSNHFPFYDNPKEFYSVLFNFLNKFDYTKTI